MSINLSSREALQSIVDKFETLLFDCDGVLWKGETAIDGVAEVVQMLRDIGRKRRRSVQSSY